jgi:hypothetical protein
MCYSGKWSIIAKTRNFIGKISARIKRLGVYMAGIKK